MVLGILGAIAGATAIPMSAVALPNSASATSTSAIGVSQGANNGGRAQGEKGKGGVDKDDPRLVKFTLKTHCDEDSPEVREVHKRVVVLRKGKVCFGLRYMI